ncbi:MAG TPA: hypothetical protein DCS91_12870 [Microcoleaceae bacterium UBA11344]|nr:hypothetical protein [Microcoleaceae cyanobacterium UBA11344]
MLITSQQLQFLHRYEGTLEILILKLFDIFLCAIGRSINFLNNPYKNSLNYINSGCTPDDRNGTTTTERTRQCRFPTPK